MKMYTHKIASKLFHLLMLVCGEIAKDPILREWSTVDGMYKAIVVDWFIAKVSSMYLLSSLSYGITLLAI